MPPKKLADLRRNLKCARDDRGRDGHDGQESGTDVGDAHHDLFQIVGRALAGPIAGNERAEALEVFGHVFGIERDGRPEIAEEVDQHDVQQVVDERVAALKCVVQAAPQRIIRIRLIQHAEKNRGKHQQAAGENDRHDAGLIDAQRQVLPGAAIHAPAAHMLGALRGNAPLAQRDKHHARHHGQKHHGQQQQHFDAQLARSAAQLGRCLAEQLSERARHAGQNARHDQQADAVADAELIDLLAQPHQEDGAGGHRQYGHHLPANGQVAGVIEETVFDQMTLDQEAQVHPALPDTQDHGGIASVFVDFLAAAFAFFLQPFERGPDAAQELKNNGRRNVGHDAQTEDRDLIQLTGAEQRDLFEQSAQPAGRIEIAFHLLLIDYRQRDLPANAIDQQQGQREEDLLAQLRDREDDAEFFPHGSIPLRFLALRRRGVGKITILCWRSETDSDYPNLTLESEKGGAGFPACETSGGVQHQAGRPARCPQNASRPRGSTRLSWRLRRPAWRHPCVGL